MDTNYLFVSRLNQLISDKCYSCNNSVSAFCSTSRQFWSISDPSCSICNTHFAFLVPFCPYQLICSFLKYFELFSVSFSISGPFRPIYCLLWTVWSVLGHVWSILLPFCSIYVQKCAHEGSLQ